MGEGARTLDSWDHNPVLYQLSYTHRMRQKGFEPLTHGLEGRCSIQLSYWRACRLEMLQSPGDRHIESGRADLNGRPPAPKAGALPGCATPRRCSVLLETAVTRLPYHAIQRRTIQASKNRRHFQLSSSP